MRPSTTVLAGVTGAVLLAEPLALVALGVVFREGVVPDVHGPALLRQLLTLPASWTLTASRPLVTQAVYAAEAVLGALLLVLSHAIGHGPRRS